MSEFLAKTTNEPSPALPFLLGDSGFKESRAQAKWFAQSSSTDVPGDPNTNPIVVEFLAFPLL